MPVYMKITPSTAKGKKYTAVFSHKVDGKIKKIKTTHFGSAGASDYLQHKDKERRERYRQRHKKDLKTNDYMRAGYLAYFLLWGDTTSLQKNISIYKKRFNLK